MPLPNLAQYLIERGSAFAQCPDPDADTESWLWILNTLGQLGIREKLGTHLEYIIRYMEIKKSDGDRARKGEIQLDYDDALKLEYVVAHSLAEVEEILSRYLPDLNVINTPGKIGWPFT